MEQPSCRSVQVPCAAHSATRSALRPTSSWAARLVAALAVGLSACGSGGDEPPPATTVAPDQRAQATLGAAGGSVLLATREGARFTLTVPAGAVPEGTVLALETAAPGAGRRMHLRLSPAGLVPAQALVLTVALPASMALPSGATLAYDRAPVAATRLGDGSLQLHLAALAAPRAASPQQGRARALAARALADAPPNPCGSAPALDGTPDGGLADTGPIEADLYGSCMLGAVNALAVSGAFSDAVRLASSIGAYLQSIGAANTDQLSTQFLNQARTLACTAYGEALDSAEATQVTRFSTLTRAVKPVLFWEATVQRLGVACPGIAPTRHASVIEDLTSRALIFFALRKDAWVDVGSVEFTEAVGEARETSSSVAQVRSLQPPPAVQNLAHAQLEQRAQPAIVDSVLQPAWQRCRDSGQYDRLIDLMQAAGSPAAVKTAAQYCGTQLGARALAADGSTSGTLAPAALGGVAATVAHTRGTLQIDTTGTLVLQGPVRALGCPAGTQPTPEALELRLDGRVLRTLPPGPYLADALGLSLPDALRDAGIDAASFRSATLSLHRTGTPCNGFWGEAPAPLLTVTLTGPADELVFQAKAYTRHSGIYPDPFTGSCASAPSTVQFPDGEYFYRIRITFPTATRPGKARFTLVQTPVARERIVMSTASDEVFSSLPDGTPLADGVNPAVWATDPAVRSTLAVQPQFRFTPAAPGSRNGVLSVEHAFDEPSDFGSYRYLEQLNVTVEGSTARVVYALRTLRDGVQFGCAAQWRAFDAMRVN